APAQQDELERDAAPPEVAASLNEDVEALLRYQPTNAHDAPRAWLAGWNREFGQVDPVPAHVDLSRCQAHLRDEVRAIRLGAGGYEARAITTHPQVLGQCGVDVLGVAGQAVRLATDLCRDECERRG